MQPHPPTLALVLVLLVLQAALAVLFLAVGHPQERGLRRAGISLLTLAAGLCVVMVGRTALHSAVMIGVGNALLLGGACSFWLAIRRFYGRRIRYWAPVALGVAVLAAFVGLTALRSQLHLRVVLASLTIAALALVTAREFTRPTRDEVWSGPRWLCAAVFGLFGLAALGRAWLVHRDPNLGSPIAAHPGNLLLLFAALLLFAFLGMGMALVLAQRLESRQRRLAQTDLLTGLLNRRGFEGFGRRVLARAQARNQFTSLILLDLDHFKRINDTFGHGAGDLVLERVGSLLQAHLRERDGAGRLGGEELAILLPETHPSFAVPIAERIRLAIEAMEVAWEGETIPVTASLGVSGTDEAESDLSALLNLADQRLYVAKAEGRNRVVGR